MASAAPLFQEHTSLGKITAKGVHSDQKKLEEFAKNMQEAVGSTEGVLAAYTALTPNLVDGKVAYIHFFRTKDEEARERALLQAHAVHGKHLFKHCEVSSNLLGKVEVPGAKDHHSDFQKLSSARLTDVFDEVPFVDWESQPIGSHAAKFPAIRVFYIKYKDNISRDLIAAHHELLASLPTKYHEIKQVSFGENTVHLHKESQLYPEAALLDWDLGAVFSYASTKDRAELDSNPEYIKSRDWAHSLYKIYEIYDLSDSSVN